MITNLHHMARLGLEQVRTEGLEAMLEGGADLHARDDVFRATLMLPVTIETYTPIGGLHLSYAYDPSLVTVGEPRMAVPSDDVTLQWHAEDGILRVIAYSISGEAIVLGRSALMIPVTVPEAVSPK